MSAVSRRLPIALRIALVPVLIAVGLVLAVFTGPVLLLVVLDILGPQ